MPPIRPITVLIADDHTLVRQGLGQLCEGMGGFTVVAEAENGAQAVALARTTRPGVILMDIVMPDVDGLSALRLIQAKNPETRIAMLSSVGAMASKAEEAFRLGAIQVLSKPIDQDVLGALLAQECERIRPADGSQ